MILYWHYDPLQDATFALVANEHEMHGRVIARVTHFAMKREVVLWTWTPSPDPIPGASRSPSVTSVPEGFTEAKRKVEALARQYWRETSREFDA